MATVFERVKKVTVTSLGVPENQVSPDSTFVADLSADSLDQVELMMALEEEFSTPGKKITIPDEESEKMMTVQDVVDFLHGIGISDVQAVPRPVEKSGFPKINLPRPGFSRPGSSKPVQTGQERQRQGGGSQPGGGRHHDNRPRHDRQQQARQNNNNNPRPQQNPQPQSRPPATGNTSG